MNEKVLKTLEFYKIREMLVSHATCDPGRSFCRNLVPSVDIGTIREDQRHTTDALSRIRMKGTLSFSGVKDLVPSLKRLEIGGVLNITELLSVASQLQVVRRAVSYGFHEPSEEWPDDSLDEMFRALDPMPQTAAELRRCILSEDEIADDASDGLARVRRQMKTIDGRVHAQLNAVLSSSRAYLQDAIITMRQGRYCLPVKAEYKALVPGMVHDQSSTGSTVFIEPMAVIRLNNELRELEIQEKREIEYILAALSAELTPYTGVLTENQKLLSRLDFIFARAEFSRSYNGTEPVFNTDRRIHIKDGRHPLLDPKTVVPTSIWLGDTFDLLIITGPNTGGKTVSLKTVGLFTLMGQAGLHIPAFEGSELAVFREVFADIGDEQSIEQNLSTFSAHMKNIVEILGKADTDSLCLFDELGAGTDPTEGAALAISVLNFLHNMTCRTMATTHYSELKVYALQTPGVENACCEFNVETLAPTYRLLIGIPGKSNAFAISRKLGLPDYIIDDAKKRIDEQDESFEDVIATLEDNRVTIEREREEIARYKAEIEALRESLRKKEERSSTQREKLLESARAEAEKILQDARETANQTIRSINRIAQDAGVSRELEAERAKLHEKLKSAEKKAPGRVPDKPRRTLSASDLRLGDTVRVLSMNMKGTVASLPNGKGDLTVRMGIMTSNVNIADLELIEEDTISGPGIAQGARRKGPSGRPGSGAGRGGQTTGSGRIGMSKSLSISPEVNLIGMTTDEAIPAMTKYLDDAYLAHLEEVRVIHGRGTGALRDAVHRELRRLKYVKSFRLGEFDEGGTGATVVIFK